MNYVFRDNPIVLAGLNNAKDADPQVIGESIARLAERSPEALVEKAKARSHPLHKHFEWDNDVAAHKHRLQQARWLFQCIRIEDEDGQRPAFVSISVHDGEGRQYVTSEEIGQSKHLQLRVLKQAESDLRAWETRYRELTDICSMVSTARSKLNERRADLENRAH